MCAHWPRPPSRYATYPEAVRLTLPHPVPPPPQCHSSCSCVKVHPTPTHTHTPSGTQLNPPTHRTCARIPTSASFFLWVCVCVCCCSCRLVGPLRAGVRYASTAGEETEGVSLGTLGRRRNAPHRRCRHARRIRLRADTKPMHQSDLSLRDTTYTHTRARTHTAK